VTTDLEDQNGNGSSTEALTAGASVGIDRSWVRSALGLAFDTSYVDLGTPVLDPDTNMFVTLNQTQLNSAVTAQYRRDISRRWAASARLGVGVVTALEGAEFAAVVTPVGGATVNYFRQFGLVTGNFGLGVTRAVAPNLFVATNTTSNAAALTAGIPLPWFRRGPEFTVQVAGSAGASMFETVTLDINDPQSRWLLFNADAAVIWSARPGLDVALRYQFVHQNGDEVDLPTQVADFTRNTVLITVGVRYPTRQAAVMPDRTPLRVDRADETPIGDEGQSTGEAPARR
jgi:hypothetical protein